MAADLNQVALVGRATRDAELRGNGAVLAIRLAFTTRTKNGDEWEDRSNYADVVVFGRRAEALERYISKGTRIGISGRLEWREWTTDSGDKRQQLQLVADEVQLLGSKDEGGGGGAAKQVEPERAPLPADDSDIPF